MPRKTFRVKDENGNWVDIDPKTVKNNPIQHESLEDNILSRIRDVYEVLRDVIVFNEHPMSLEQFEVNFMREVNPEEALQVWGVISNAYSDACQHFSDDISSKKEVYRWILLLLMNCVSEEELELDDVKIVKKALIKAFSVSA